MSEQFLRFPAVRSITQLSRSTIWRLEKARLFPARRKLSPNTVGWLRSEIESYISSRQPVRLDGERQPGSSHE